VPASGEAVLLTYLDARPAHERASHRLSIDPASANVIAHDRYEDRPPGVRLTGSMFPLHKGSYFGIGGTVIAMLASLAMPLFAVTGWMLYLRRRKLRPRVGDRLAA